MDRTHESRQSLWLLTYSPAIWFAHFTASYLAASIWCTQFDTRGGPLGPVPTLVGLFTAAAVGGIALVAWMGWRRHTHGEEGGSAPHDADTPEDRHRFLGLATLLLSGLSLVGTVFVGTSALLSGTCR